MRSPLPSDFGLRNSLGLRVSLFGILLLLPLGPPHAQPASPTNHVLDLDGKGSYVRLPDDIFHNLTEGTVEAWVNWDNITPIQRFFNVGDLGNDIGAGIDSGGLTCFVNVPGKQFRALELSVNLQARQWYHVAVSTGPGGMKLFLNGLLIATNA